MILLERTSTIAYPCFFPEKYAISCNILPALYSTAIQSQPGYCFLSNTTSKAKGTSEGLPTLGPLVIPSAVTKKDHVVVFKTIPKISHHGISLPVYSLSLYLNLDVLSHVVHIILLPS